MVLNNLLIGITLLLAAPNPASCWPLEFITTLVVAETRFSIPCGLTVGFISLKLFLFSWRGDNNN